MNFPGKKRTVGSGMSLVFLLTVQTSQLTSSGPQFRKQMFTYVIAFFQTQQLFVSVFFLFFSPSNHQCYPLL